jgi:hypothetical protein
MRFSGSFREPLHTKAHRALLVGRQFQKIFLIHFQSLSIFFAIPIKLFRKAGLTHQSSRVMIFTKPDGLAAGNQPRGKTMNTSSYYQVSIPSAGFGMYQREPVFRSGSTWANLYDLEAEIAQSISDEFLPLDEALEDPAFVEAGVEDIRGRIYGGDPTNVYAILEDGQIGYFGIEEVEAPDNYWVSC